MAHYNNLKEEIKTFQGTTKHEDCIKRHPPDLSLEYPLLSVFKKLFNGFENLHGQNLATSYRPLRPIIRISIQPKQKS